MNNEFDTVKIERTSALVLIKLNRPEVRNAINNHLISDLTKIFENLKSDKNHRIIIISGSDGYFCAGADLNWMKDVINYDFETNLKESQSLVNLLRLIQNHHTPIIARVEGAAIGGGVGLAAACDLVVSDKNTVFGFSEVRLGIVPAVISPFIVKRCGYSLSKRYFLTGERINGEKALEIGLVDEIADQKDLDGVIIDLSKKLLQCSPDAIIKVKELMSGIINYSDSDIDKFTSNMISELRLSKDGQEGMNAFIEKRKPNWFLEI